MVLLPFFCELGYACFFFSTNTYCTCCSRYKKKDHFDDRFRFQSDQHNKTNFFFLWWWFISILRVNFVVAQPPEMPKWRPSVDSVVFTLLIVARRLLNARPQGMPKGVLMLRLVAGDVVRWAASSPLAHRRSSVELLPRCKVHRLHLLRGQGPRASGSSSLSVAAWCPVDGRATATARPWQYIFNFQREIEKYCKQNISILRLAYLAFRKNFINTM